MKRLILAGLVVALAVPSLVSAASVANPAAVVGKENYGFTLEIENQKKEIDGDLTESRRYLGKAIWGATDRFDLYVRLGVSDQKVYADGAPGFRGHEGMTYGAGIRFLIAETAKPNLQVLFDFQGLGYSSNGTVYVPRTSGDDAWVEKYDNVYDMREYQFSLFAVWKREIWQPYIGFSLTNISGEVKRDLYLIADDSEVFEKSGKDEFGENAIPEFVAGGDINLGTSGRLSGELRFAQGEISFFVGLSELWH
jgi:hypothetical protein